MGFSEAVLSAQPMQAAARKSCTVSLAGRALLLLSLPCAGRVRRAGSQLHNQLLSIFHKGKKRRSNRAWDFFFNFFSEWFQVGSYWQQQIGQGSVHAARSNALSHDGLFFFFFFLVEQLP